MPALTGAQTLLACAADLPQPFHESDLAEAAWRARPDLFGMKTKETQYPDLNKTRTYLVGGRGLITRGLFEKRGPLLYSLTHAGKAEAAKLAAGGGLGRNLKRVQPRPECEARLARALLSPALIRWRGGQQAYVNWPDALAFWAPFAAGEPAPLAAGRESLAACVREARDAIVDGACRFRSGQQVRAAELDELVRLDQWLAQRFRRELERSGVTA